MKQAGFYWGMYWSLLMDGKPSATVTLPPVASVPDFTAGLIFGFTGNDHRVELEGCMTTSTKIVTDAEKFVSDIKGGEIVQGL